MSREIERVFLVARRPRNLARRPHARIRQGYLVIAKDASEVRIRQIGSRHVLTWKGRGKLARDEIEIGLSRRQFEALWPASAPRRLHKTRYRIRWRGHTIELDVFAGKLKGLVLAEVEFGSPAQSRRFRPPAWFGREVTREARYKNQNLAVHGLPKH